MSRRDDKQVQEALEAIRKLVEVSEDKFEASSDDVVTLDNVVWRNPSKNEAEEEIILEEASSPAIAEVSQHDSISSKRAAIAPQASASISARDLDEAKKPAKTPTTSPLKTDVRNASFVAPALRSPSHKNAEEKLQADPSREAHNLLQSEPVPRSQAEELPIMPLAFMPPVEENITDLTTPIARKGGGFYSDASDGQKPVIETKPLPVEVEMVQHKDPVKGSAFERPIIISEPAITDFHGADFTFSASEGLMSASSFDEVKAGLSQPLRPDVQVPVATAAVSDPVAEVQAMHQEPHASEEETESPFEDDSLLMSGQPNLHIVSDQTASPPQEEEGFSSAVRLALRSIIKEQVSSWLQGNMTDLIEEALTNPQKRPSSSSKPSSKKR